MKLDLLYWGDLGPYDIDEDNFFIYKNYIRPSMNRRMLLKLRRFHEVKLITEVRIRSELICKQVEWINQNCEGKFFINQNVDINIIMWYFASKNDAFHFSITWL